ncbi:uncharacterized protein LOC119770128 [Culex quinquefasciatus]|uniref:uncharacterized protein LOC119770128 n=1 Tax=Culex quinquefasciatus TaxID=7176 RepID=UPI0018E2CD80|nr:uncharacterized protein LOC119770128 [Culex quinquefasciatus]
MPTGQVLLYSGLRSENAQRANRPINERIIVARFRTRVRNLTFVQVYAPTDAADLQEKEEFYSQLSGVVNEIPKGDIRIYAGDFNAKIGSDNTDLERIMGPHGLGEMSENGELFTEFCGNQDMVIGGSLFPHRSVHKVTRVSRDGRTENQIDHICISRQGFCRRAQARALEIPDSTVEEEWQFIKDAFAVTGENTLGMLRTQRKEWISDATWDKIEERKQAKAAIVSARTRATKARTRQTYAELEKAVKRSCRGDKRAWTDSLADEGEKAANNGDMRLLYDISRRLCGARTNTRIPVKDRSGQLITDPADQLKRWFEHFEQLLQSRIHVQALSTIRKMLGGSTR